MSKYLVLSKFRLTDKNVYLDAGDVYDPDDINYENSSRSLAAGLRALWIRKLTDAEFQKIEKQKVKAEKNATRQAEAEVNVSDPVVKAVEPVIAKAVKRRIGNVDFVPEDLADEVTPAVEQLVVVRDKRQVVAKNEVIAAKNIKNEIKMKIKKNALRIGKKS